MKLFYKFIYIVLMLLTILFYFTCKKKYSFDLCVLCIVLFFAFFCLYLKIVKIKNYFCFELLFSTSYFFVYFVYPVFIYPVNKTRFFSFAYGFDENIITKSTFLALIGYSVFLFGLMSKKVIEKDIIAISVNRDYKKSIGYLPVIMVAIALMVNVIKIFVLGYSVYWGVTAPRIWGYISEISHSIVMAVISIKFSYLLKSKKNKSLKKLIYEDPAFWVIITLYIIVLLYSGGRGEPLCIMLSLLAAYYLYKGKIKLKTFVFLILMGITVLSVIGIMRLRTGGLTLSFDIFDLTMDLILNNYTLYFGFDYVNQHGYFLFPLINSLLRVIPFASGIITRLFAIPNKYTSSAIFFTTLILGEHSSLGLGTNIISSLYLSVGFWGVIAGMYILGRFVKYIVNSVSNTNNLSIYKLMIYFELIGSSVYWVRSEYFFPIAHFVISALIIRLLIRIQLKFGRN